MEEFFGNTSILKSRPGNAGQPYERSDTLHRRGACGVVIGLVLSVFVSGVLAGQSEGQSEKDSEFGLFALPFEEVMDIEVISPTRVAGQDVFTSPAAIYVITQEDIRRSGLDILPEWFRLAPGVHVGHINASTWGIAIRGLNAEFNNRLLVLIDGRSIYTPRFGGVDWDMHNLPVDIIDRIEVIRGPGGTLWGANAFDGVINIITKPASETQGSLFSVGGGNEHQAATVGRHGGRIGDDGYYRVYGMYDLYDDLKLSNGSDAADEWWSGRWGYRFDFGGDADRFTLQGDFNYNRRHTAPPFLVRSDKGEAYGTNVLGRWTRILDDDSELALQVYYDMTNRKGFIVEEERHVGDIELQHSFVPADGHHMVWGLGYRVDGDDVSDTALTEVAQPRKTRQTVSAFVQDSFYFSPDLLRFIVGSKFERNQFTGFEYQPSARLVYTPHAQHTFWGAISRAVRTPTRGEDDFISAGIVFPNKDLDSEELTAYELGYRYKPSKSFFLDLTFFANHYDNLINRSPVDLTLRNLTDGEAHGVEIASSWQVNDKWRLVGNYTFFDLELHGVNEIDEGAFPNNMVSIRSFMDIGDKLELNSSLYYTDSVPRWAAPSGVRLDVGLVYRPGKNLEFSVVGQYLLDSQQGPEMTARNTSQMVEPERAVFARVTYKF